MRAGAYAALRVTLTWPRALCTPNLPPARAPAYNYTPCGSGAAGSEAPTPAGHSDGITKRERARPDLPVPARRGLQSCPAGAFYERAALFSRGRQVRAQELRWDREDYVWEVRL